MAACRCVDRDDSSGGVIAGVERQLTANLTLSVNGFPVRGHDLTRTVNVNLPPPTILTTTMVQPVRPPQGLGVTVHGIGRFLDRAQPVGRWRLHHRPMPTDLFGVRAHGRHLVGLERFDGGPLHLTSNLHHAKRQRLQWARGTAWL